MPNSAKWHSSKTQVLCGFEPNSAIFPSSALGQLCASRWQLALSVTAAAVPAPPKGEPSLASPLGGGGLALARTERASCRPHHPLPWLSPLRARAPRSLVSFWLTPTKVKTVGRCPTPCKLFEKSLSKNFTLASLGTPPLGLHCIYTMRNSGWLNSTTWPLPTQISATVPSSSAGISFISFMASMMHSVSPFFTWSPTSTKGRASGLGAE